MSLAADNSTVINQPWARMQITYGGFQAQMKKTLQAAEQAARTGDDTALARCIELMLADLITLAANLKQEMER